MIVWAIVFLLIAGIVFAFIPNVDARIKTAVIVFCVIVFVLGLLSVLGLMPHRPLW